MPDMVLRLAREHDVQELAEVAVLSWRTTFAGLVASDFLESMSVSGQVQRFSRALGESPKVELWVADEGQKIAGYGTIGPDRSPGAMPGVYELYALYLRPEVWRQELGRRLHDHLLERLGDLNAPRVVLWVLELNDSARGFYEALGWQQTGRRRELALGDQSYSAVQYGRLIPSPGEPRGPSSAEGSHFVAEPRPLPRRRRRRPLNRGCPSRRRLVRSRN